MKILTISTNSKEKIVDITDLVNEQVDIDKGLCNVFISHTTAAITISDLEPGTDQDLLESLRALVPKLTFRHQHSPRHFPDHLISSLVGVSLTIPVKNKNLHLGRWQKVILVELDGPREREIIITCIKG